jgi:hypothetical protein
VVHRRGDVLRRRQAAPFLHLQSATCERRDEYMLVTDGINRQVRQKCKAKASAYCVGVRPAPGHTNA